MLNRYICCNGRPREVALVRIRRQGDAGSCRLVVRSKAVVVAQNSLSKIPKWWSCDGYDINHGFLERKGRVIWGGCARMIVGESRKIIGELSRWELADETFRRETGET